MEKVTVSDKEVLEWMTSDNSKHLMDDEGSLVFVTVALNPADFEAIKSFANEHFVSLGLFLKEAAKQIATGKSEFASPEYLENEEYFARLRK